VNGYLLPNFFRLMGYLVSVSLGGYLLGKGAEQLLGRFQARIVGALVLGSAVTIPEYLFAIVSVLDQKNAQALGSAYGGNIFLFTVAYGALFLASSRRGSYIRGYKGMRSDLVILFVSTTLFVLSYFERFLSLYLGFALLLLYAAFIFSGAGRSVNTSISVRSLSKKVKLTALVYLFAGLALTFVFIHPLVEEVSSFSFRLGVSPVITALFVVPIGDELPEILSAVTLIRSSVQGEHTALASLVGSKIQSNTLLLGTITVLAYALGNPIFTGESYAGAALFAMAATTYLGLAITFLSPKNRGVGVVLVAAYFVSAGYILSI
jgi:cation:H+ antiporter